MRKKKKLSGKKLGGTEKMSRRRWQEEKQRAGRARPSPAEDRALGGYPPNPLLAEVLGTARMQGATGFLFPRGLAV